MKVRFNRKRTTGNSTTIRAIIRWNGQKIVLPTGVTVDQNQWDSKRERSKTDETANAKLAEIRTRIVEHHKKTGIPPTKQDIQKPNAQKITDVVINHGKQVVRRNGATNTMRAYSTLAKSLTRYDTDQNRKERFLDDITENYIEGFMIWLINQNYSDSHTTKMMRTLRTVMRNKVPNDRWQNVKPPTLHQVDTIYLTIDEIAKIENLKLERGSTADRTRDQFLTGYYTGQRHSDWHQITPGKIWGNKIKMITINQAKTKTQVTIPIQPKLLQILNRHPKGVPQLSNQRFNRTVKELAKMAGITQIVSVSQYRGRELTTKSVEKWTLVSSHTARRSFATNAYLSGIPILEIMKFTGHRSMSAFMTYIRITATETAMNYANHPFFQ